MKLLVTNEGPSHADEAAVMPELLTLFRTIIDSPNGLPFTHQAEAFDSIEARNRQVRLIAGTAAGKTLAVAIPLAWKLREGLIRRVMFLYPTLALLEDQRKVIDRLADQTELEVGEVKGGMTRTQLLRALNKNLILATPDAVYWFFRKNVKYSSLLIYGLAQVDEFVLDEAHLFNGLVLCNFKHLWHRVKTLAKCVGKTPRLHVLTATPSDELRVLNDADEISGKSKGSDVSVEFRPVGWRDRDQEFIKAVDEILSAGQRKLLVVCNSARMAHQLFEKFKVKAADQIPIEHRLRFGKAPFAELRGCLEKSGIDTVILEKLDNGLSREEAIRLADVPNGLTVRLPVEDVALTITEMLERQSWQVKRALWKLQQSPGETLNSLLHNRSLPCCIVNQIRRPLEETQELKLQEALVDAWLAGISEKVSGLPDDWITCRAGEFREVEGAFISAGIDTRLSSLLTKSLIFEMNADPRQFRAKASAPVIYLRRLDSLTDPDSGHRIREAIKAGLESGELEVEFRHIGRWKGTDVPVIVYSGSMARRAREGLVNVFGELERAILISTSAVEVGVDFHADSLITEECEGNSFVQRFGRVGRHGEGSKVIALLSGETYSTLAELKAPGIGREEFSERIVQAFPHRAYAAASPLLDATHYLINEQLGRIGERLNRGVNNQVKAIADQLRSAGIQMGFGLRSTMPQITLRDGVAKDPFYLLRYVDDRNLRAADSPFEVARANTWFTRLIFEKARFDIIVDLSETLKASQHIILLHSGEPRPFSGSGVAWFHLCKLQEKFQGWSDKQSLFFVLSHGDVYLSRIDRDLEMPPQETVRDAHANPLFIPNQTYLVLWGWTDPDKTSGMLENAGVANWEELYYDWDRLQYAGPMATVILERTTGACFAAYQHLVSYVDRNA